MRGLVLVVAAACGSVSDNKPDAAGGDAAPVDAPAAAPGEYRWVRSLSSMQGYGVADGPGGLVVTGGITAPANLGGNVLTPVGSYDMVVAGFMATDASHLYSVRHGAAGQEFAFLETTEAQGAPLVHGVSYGTVDLGTGEVTGGGGAGADGFIGRYGPGAPAWLARIVGPGEDKIVGSALGQGSTVWGAGWFEGTTRWNNADLVSTGDREIFLARHNTATGVVELTKQYGGTGRDEASSIASRGTTLALAGFFNDTIAFGGTAQPITSAGLLDCYVAKLAADGTGVWAQRFGGAGDDRDPQLAVDAAGDIYVAGSFQQQVAFGAINLVSKGGFDLFVAKLRGTDGSVAWAVSYGSPGDDGASRIHVDSQGRIALSGTLGGALDGGTPAGGVDAIVAGFDAATGAQRWRHVYATAGDERSFALTIGRDGDVYALVALGGEIDFGKPIIGPASPASVLLRIAP